MFIQKKYLKIMDTILGFNCTKQAKTYNIFYLHSTLIQFFPKFRSKLINEIDYRINYFFGGYAVYYLGVYSYGTTVTQAPERAYRLTRLDGIESLASIVGTLASPYISLRLGFYGSFVSSGLLHALALAYLIFVVKEPLKGSPANVLHDSKAEGATKNTRKRVLAKVSCFCEAVLLTPLKGMKSVLTKERKPALKLLIVLQFLSYSVYIFSYQAFRLTYLYMSLVFDDFSPKDFAFYQGPIL
jgi:hypothetical protein